MTAQENRKSLLALSTVLMLVSIFFALAWGFFAYNHSHFITHDLKNFLLATQVSFADYLALSVDIHFVPLHRALNYTILSLFPMSFSAALVLLLCFHLLALFFLYRLLQVLNAGPANALILFLYACNAFLAVPLMWWSSGLHRFPYIMLSIICLYHYACYRRWHKKKSVFYCAVAYLLALGFYSKAILIPVYILALELCLWSVRPSQKVADNFKLIGILLAFFMAYCFWYTQYADTKITPVVSDFNITSIIDTVSIGVNVTLMSIVPLTKSLTNSWIFYGILITLFLVFLVNKELRVLPLVCGLGLIVLNIAVIAVSSRGYQFGVFLVFTPRYYYELYFLVAIFSCLAFGDYLNRRIYEWIGKTSLPGITVVVSAFLLVYLFLSVRYSAAQLENKMQRYEFAAHYVRGLMESVFIHESGTLSLVDEPIPDRISSGVSRRPIMLSEYFSLYGYAADFVSPSDALYRVGQDGYLQEVGSGNM